MKESGFTSAKRKNHTVPHTVTDADYADDIALLANPPAQAETLLHGLERVAG